MQAKKERSPRSVCAGSLDEDRYGERQDMYDDPAQSAMMRNRISLRRIVSVVASAVILALGGASGVLAHNSLSASDPVDGATLDIAPTTWTLSFTKEVPLDSASAEVVLSDGTRVALQPAVHGASTSIIVFTLPEDVAGAVTARWRLVGSDGHAITGRVQFTVAPTSTTTAMEDSTTTIVPADDLDPVESTVVTINDEVLDTPEVEQSPTSGLIDPLPESIHWVLQILSYLGLVSLGGLVFAEIALARGILRRPRAILAMQVGALALFITSAVKTLIYVGDLAGVSLGSAFAHVGGIFDTTSGSMLAVRTLIGFVLLMITLALDQHPPPSSIVTILGALMLLHVVTMPYTGHSRSMRWPLLGVPIDIVHIIGMTVWAGGLVALVAFIMPAARTGHAVVAYVRFSPYASASVIAIVVTGVIQSIRLHGSPTSVLDSSHGVILVIKIVLVAVMLGVGWQSRRLLTADDVRPDVELRNRLIRATALEAGLGVLVIGVTAALVRAAFSS